MKQRKVCQSCAMPLKKGPMLRGTEKDGSINGEFCIYCYKEGQFTQEDITAEEMQNQARRAIMKKFKFPSLLARFLTRKIPKLSRWTKTKK